MRAEKNGPPKTLLFPKPATWPVMEKRSWLFLGILLLPLLYFVIAKNRGLFFVDLGLGVASLLGGWFIARSSRWNAFAERTGPFWKNNFCIAAVVILYAVVVLGLSPRVFLSNDDMFHLSDIRGGFDVSFISLIIGRCLSLLYGLAPSIPFYGLFLYSVHALSLGLFIKTFSRLKEFTAWFPFFLIAYLSLYARFLMQVSYTNAALMIGINALMYCVSRLMEEERRTVVFVLSGVLFSLCFLVRRQALLGVLIFSAVLCAWLLIKDKRSWKALAVFFIPVVLAVLADGLMARYGVSESYKAFQRVNSPRSRVHGFPILARNEDNPRLLRVNGWTKNDMILFKYFFFPNERKFNETTMKNFFVERLPGPAIRPKDVLSRASHIIDGYHIQFFFLASLLILTVFSGRQREIKWVFLNAAYFFSGMVAMALVARFPSRIGNPISLLLLESSVLFVFQGGTNAAPRKPWNRPLYAFFIVCCLAVLSLGGIRYARNAENLASAMKKTRAITQKLNAEYAGALFLVPFWPWKQNLDPLRDSGNTYEIIPAGWSTFSERFYDVIGRRVGVKHGYDLFPRFLSLKDAYIVGKKDFIRDSMRQYLWDNHRLRCAFVEVEMLNRSTGIFRVIEGRDGRRRNRPSPDKGTRYTGK